VTSKQQLEKELQDSNGVVFVDFYSTNCPPCRIFAPLFDAWTKEFGSKIKFLKVNADKAADVFHAYQIQVVPTLLIFDEKGNIIRKSIGFKEISEVDRRLEKMKGKQDFSPQDFK
jgi:thioredoxin 1